MAYYPVNANINISKTQQAFMKEIFVARTNSNIIKANKAIKVLAKKHNYAFINVNDGLSDEEGNLKDKYTIEGIHLWPNAYYLIFNSIKKYLD